MPDATTVLTIEPLGFNLMGNTMVRNFGGAVCRDRKVVPVDYPASLGRQSIDKGVESLNRCLHSTPERLLVFAHSHGVQVVSRWLRTHAGDPDAPDPTLVSFLLIGNPLRKYGGAGVGRPELDGSLGLPTPTDTQYRVFDVTLQYDGWADAPTLPSGRRPKPAPVCTRISQTSASCSAAAATTRGRGCRAHPLAISSPSPIPTATSAASSSRNPLASRPRRPGGSKKRAVMNEHIAEAVQAEVVSSSHRRHTGAHGRRLVAIGVGAALFTGLWIALADDGGGASSGASPSGTHVSGRSAQLSDDFASADGRGRAPLTTESTTVVPGPAANAQSVASSLAAEDRRRIHETGIQHHAAGTEFLPCRLQQRGEGRDRLDSVGDFLRRAVSRRSRPWLPSLSRSHTRTPRRPKRLRG